MTDLTEQSGAPNQAVSDAGQSERAHRPARSSRYAGTGIPRHGRGLTGREPRSGQDGGRLSSATRVAPPPQLIQTIEQAVLPEMIRARRGGPRRVQSRDADAAFCDDEIATLAALSLSTDSEDAVRFVDVAQQGRGAGVEELCLGLLAPAARRLGTLWCDDTCSFMDVTIGMGRLQRALFGLNPRFLDARRSDKPSRRILMLPTPGEQHTFGLQMAAEFFRRDGWEVDGDVSATCKQACGRVRAMRYDAVGLSLGSEALVDSCARSIRSIRLASKNETITVIIGGQLIEQRPEFVDAVGADAPAGAGSAAPREARTAVTECLALC